MADDASHHFVEDFTIEDLGKAHKVMVTGHDTYIYGT